MLSRIIRAGFFLTAALALTTLAEPQPAMAAGACSQLFAPVCGLKRDGTRSTFSNACFARLDHARVLHAGECSGAICFFIEDPVCARPPRGRPRTYSNACVAENANAVFLRKGKCK